MSKTEKQEHAPLTQQEIKKLNDVFTLARKASYEDEKTLAELINFKRELFQKLAPLVEKKEIKKTA